MKQAIVFRADLKIGKGKIAAHAGHAAVVGYRAVEQRNPKAANEWLESGQKKVVLKVKDEKELVSLFERISGRIPSEIIRDAGMTQVQPGTVICLVIGPWKDDEIDRYTKDFKLL